MIIRQGDIYLLRVAPAAVPRTFVHHSQGACIVGYGEVTGHKHVIAQAQWLVDACHDIHSLRRFAEDGRSDTTIFVRINEPTTIEHEEHAPLALPEGVYHVVRQREYAPGEVRRVRD